MTDSVESDLVSAFCSVFLGGRAGLVPAPSLFIILRSFTGIN